MLASPVWKHAFQLVLKKAKHYEERIPNVRGDLKTLEDLESGTFAEKVEQLKGIIEDGPILKIVFDGGRVSITLESTVVGIVADMAGDAVNNVRKPLWRRDGN